MAQAPYIIKSCIFGDFDQTETGSKVTCVFGWTIKGIQYHIDLLTKIWNKFQKKTSTYSPVFLFQLNGI